MWFIFAKRNAYYYIRTCKIASDRTRGEHYSWSCQTVDAAIIALRNDAVMFRRKRTVLYRTVRHSVPLESARWNCTEFCNTTTTTTATTTTTTAAAVAAAATAAAAITKCNHNIGLLCSVMHHRQGARAHQAISTQVGT